MYKSKYKTKWKQQIVDRVREMNNEQLFDDMLDLANGDSWDGCFTSRGAWEYDYIVNEFRSRAADWLRKSISERSIDRCVCDKCGQAHDPRLVYGETGMSKATKTKERT